VRRVLVEKTADEGLGISITGGKEHGVPILISEILLHQPAHRSGGLYVGDAILSVNGFDLRNVKHAEAVHILSQQEGNVDLEVIFVSPDDDSDDESHDYEDENGFRYRIYDDDVASELSSTPSSDLSMKPFTGSIGPSESAVSLPPDSNHGPFDVSSPAKSLHVEDLPATSVVKLSELDSTSVSLDQILKFSNSACANDSCSANGNTCGVKTDVRRIESK